MKMTKFLSVLFALIAVCTAAATVWLGFSNRDAAPILQSPPLVAKSQAVAMMNSLCKGDFEGVSERLLGNPSLGLDRSASQEVGVMIWDSYMDSLSYEMEGTCYATDKGLAQNVKLTCLDITSVTANLQERTNALLAERVENTPKIEVYDDDHEYREEFVMDVLQDAVAAALEEDAREMTVELTLNLAYQDGQWWVVADNALMDAISGGILY